jgi:hypothetical protein
MLPAVATAIPGHDRKSYGRRCRGRHEESDGCIVPVKPRTTHADRLVAESVEGRRPVEGRARAKTHAPDTEPGSACPRRFRQVSRQLAIGRRIGVEEPL